MESYRNATEIVLSYIKALDNGEYDTAAGYLSDDVRIRGPAGESFRKPGEFIDMLRQHRGRYDLKKTFTDEKDVCVLYDLKTPAVTVFVCSWYKVMEGKIVTIQSVFDPQAFSPKPPEESDGNE